MTWINPYIILGLLNGLLNVKFSLCLAPVGSFASGYGSRALVTAEPKAYILELAGLLNNRISIR